MKRILVIDQATKNIGYNIIEIADNKIRWIECKAIKIKGTNTAGRMLDVMSMVINVAKEFNVTNLVLEDVPLERKTNIKTMVVLLKLLGCLEVTAFKIGIPISIMNVKHWKALSGIKSKTRDLQKSEAIEISLKRWPQYTKEIISNGDDVSDSLMMGYAWLIDSGYVSRVKK